MKDLTLSKLLKDISAIVGSLLPIIQLFFNQWSFAFDKVFLAKEYFLGISIITLVVSYVLIVAYLAKPYGEILLPRQRQKQEKQQSHWTTYNNLQVQINTLLGVPNFDQKALLKLFKQQHELKLPPAPLKIGPDNHVRIAVTGVILSALVFIGLSFTKSQEGYILCVQSIAYVLIVSFAALMLTIYKKLSDNNNQWKYNNRTRVERAIKLAIDANGFTKLPQVTFVDQYLSGNFPQDLHVRAEYNNEIFDIATDTNAEYLISITKQPKP